jgi:hypothetical protein
MKVSDLKPHPGNPRRITDPELKRLRKTIELYGDLSGIVFNRRTGRLVGGHQRGKVLPPDSVIKLETKYDPPDKTGTVAQGAIHAYGTTYAYREVDWPEEREMAANLCANASGGSFESQGLIDWLTHLDRTPDFDIETTGFSDKEFEDLCAPVEVSNAEKEKCPACGK